MGSECIFLNPFDYKMTEVAFRNASGRFPQCDQFDQLAQFGGYAIGTFLSGGTGFVVKLLPGSCALILTAAHVFIQNFKFRPDQSEFVIGLNTYHAFPLRTSLDMTEDTLRIRDPVSGILSSIPDDWTLCELKQRPGEIYNNNLVPLELMPVNSILPGLAVSVIGFPSVITQGNLSYIAPSEPVSELDSVKNCFWGGGKLVRSVGEVISVGDALAVSCCTANGMSGSPVIVQIYGQLKVIGLLHSGPVSNVHYLCAKILSVDPFIDNFLQQLIVTLTEMAARTIDLVIRRDVEVLLLPLAHFKTVSSNLQESFLGIIYSRALSIEQSCGVQMNYNIVWPLTSFYPTLISSLNSF